MFEWKNEFAVNIGSIDSQHQNLFAIGRELHAAMSSGQGKSVLGPILDRLVQYTAAHFAYEEGLLMSHNYPDFVAHKAQHDSLVKQVMAFQSDFNAGKVAVAVPVLLFVKDWLEKHIQKRDFAYAPYLKAQKVA